MSFKEHNQTNVSLATLKRGGHYFAVGVRTFLFFTSLATVVLASFWGEGIATAGDEGLPTICRPTLGASRTIELGKAGVFEWTCRGGEKEGRGFYIVFIRPVGTYVLLKVPLGRVSFEFAPDMTGMWRWIVINTDPDRSLPDLESEPGYFEVTQTEEQ